VKRHFSNQDKVWEDNMITRRKLLKSTAATGLTLAASGLAAPALTQGAKIRLGYVSPQSGPLAAFSDADQFIIDGFMASEAGSNFEVIVRTASPTQTVPPRSPKS
jgi:branched-chain amino acid transport system substrate-binding protein